MNRIAIVIVLMSTGCASAPTTPDPVSVPVPISVQAPPPQVRPLLPILPANPTAGQQIENWKLITDILESYAKSLEIIIDGYRQ